MDKDLEKIKEIKKSMWKKVGEKWLNTQKERKHMEKLRFIGYWET